MAILSALLLFITCRLFPMDWPSPSGIITRNFGWNDEGQPHLGIFFQDNGTLGAVEEGELLFQRRENDSASRLPSPLGSWLALDHGDGIISIYSRFDDNSSGAVPNRAEKNMVLGESGISGWSTRNGFYFQLYDRRERRWINPVMIISPPEDIRPPVIRQIRLRDSQGRLFDPVQTRNLSQGRYTVIVDAVDTMRLPNENLLAPYRIICSVNGSEAGLLNFETYSARDGSLVVQRNGLVPVRQVFAQFPAYEIADLWFTRGQTILEIIVLDIGGNVRNVIYRLIVE